MSMNDSWFRDSGPTVSFSYWTNQPCVLGCISMLCGLFCLLVCCEKKHGDTIWWCSWQNCRDWLAI